MSNKTNGWIVGAVVVIAAVVGAGYYALHRHQRARAPQPVAGTTAPATASTTPQIKHPISQASGGPAAASSAPLPPLDQSDDTVTSALASVTGHAHLHGLLIPHDIIQRFVATVDALPRHQLGNQILPVHNPKGSFKTRKVDGKTEISPDNYRRYAPYMQIVEHTDTKKLVDWYVQHYPLFQEAYRQQGYPKGYFNDRLIAVIDNLLATPDLKQPPVLERPNVMYTYADPKLERLSVGQKMLLRAGPANEAKIKAKLRTIRSDLVGRQMPATESSVAPTGSTAPAGSAAPAHAASVKPLGH